MQFTKRMIPSALALVQGMPRTRMLPGVGCYFHLTSTQVDKGLRRNRASPGLYLEKQDVNYTSSRLLRALKTIHSETNFSETESRQFIDLYWRKVSNGNLIGDDKGQETAAIALQSLHEQLMNAASSPQITLKQGIRGLYLHGGPGRGKTMLMDLFFDELQLPKKKRTHFHTFMLDVHARLHHSRHSDDGELRPIQQSYSTWMKLVELPFKDSLRSQADPLVSVAEQIFKDVHVLCLDEFEVTDIADAMLLRRLFKLLFARGLVLVATSNQPPQNLYSGGLNRSLFLPFIDDLCQHCQIISLDASKISTSAATSPARACVDTGSSRRSPIFEQHDPPQPDKSVDPTDEISSSVDYRERMGEHETRTHALQWPPSDDSGNRVAGTPSRVHGLFRQLCGDAGGAAELRVTPSRSIHIPLARGAICMLNFEELCGTGVSVGLTDYLRIAQRFHTVLIYGVPILSQDREESARRFINLLDVLYEHHILLVADLLAPPEQLFHVDAGRGINAKANKQQHPSMFVGPNEQINLADVTVVGDGGSSGRSTTMVGGAEWSATGLTKASLAGLTHGPKGANFTFRAAPRAVSRLKEMNSLQYLQRHAVLHKPEVTSDMLCEVLGASKWPL
ncbi:hypothetical protein CYMTET_20816 [Cymbomonas tetramitiformis]|uniref:AFG1-like ATPase n=1 Tax=Cymbomonas tetramitiformis TaxID=36881 RepID=A0AAE0L3M0_9CHLO|nr:hypothetical protein CYMTET_20816 [Cymbomonas tetramitiformis]